ncbi:hypothetical protein [Desulfonema magnum]|uniref:Uncharacterized protein n=1 Tax=Desulfonema magnum TaxID=45655 RepID=A0A975BYW1_9BACT|nr:hypothetical protein [Desulfonema magnum]QTA93618.1 Uncharacterized protein dnm_097220 [Desulfonema magnum]
MLEELLIPVGIEVHTEIEVMADPPKADILLLRRTHPAWTPEQLKRLPDGIRDSGADHILLEFKYSESVGLSAFRQAVGYDYFYKDSKELTGREVQTFLISAKTTRKSTLDKFGYSPTDRAGVYRSLHPLLESVPLLILNELSEEPHNAYIKCFASRTEMKRAAFRTLKGQNIGLFSMKLLWFLQGLWKHWFFKGGAPMKQELTPEEVIEMGKIWGDIYLSTLPPEERLKGLGPEERLRGLGPKELVRAVGIEELLKGMSVKEIEAYLRKRKKKK